MSEWHTGWTEGYASARSEAQAEIKKLRAALKPFAKQYDPNKTYLVGGFYTLTVKFEDIRAAAAALKEMGE